MDPSEEAKKVLGLASDADAAAAKIKQFEAETTTTPTDPTAPTPTPGVTGMTSFATDIRPLFRQVDVDHMLDQTGLDLSSYDAVKADSQAIYDRVSSTDDTFRMPPPPDPPWTQGMVALFKKWVDDGFPR